MNQIQRLKELAETAANKMVMIELTKNKNVSVRFQLFNNKNITREILEILKEDELHLIRNEAKRLLIDKIKRGEL